MSKLDEAKQLLIHYFSLAGVQVTGDIASEIGSIVDLIAEGSKEQRNEKAITYRAEVNLEEEPIVVAECGAASAVYDVTSGEYVAEETDSCPVTDDGCWPDPPADVIEETSYSAPFWSSLTDSQRKRLLQMRSDFGKGRESDPVSFDSLFNYGPAVTAWFESLSDEDRQLWNAAFKDSLSKR